MDVMTEFGIKPALSGEDYILAVDLEITPVKLPVVSAAALADKAVPLRRWYVPDIIPSRTVTMLSGDGGGSRPRPTTGRRRRCRTKYLGTPATTGRDPYLPFGGGYLDELMGPRSIAEAAGDRRRPGRPAHVPLAGWSRLGAPDQRPAQSAPRSSGRPDGSRGEDKTPRRRPRHFGRRVRRQRNIPPGGVSVHKHLARAGDRV